MPHTVYLGTTNDLSFYASPRKMKDSDFLWEITDCPDDMDHNRVKAMLFGGDPVRSAERKCRFHFAHYRALRTEGKVRSQFTFAEALGIAEGAKVAN